MTDTDRQLPSDDQLERLQNGILSAYSYEALTRMVSFKLEEDLRNLVPFVTQELTGILHDLVVEYASRPGGLHRLAAAAQAGIPTNIELTAMAEELLAIDLLHDPGRRGVTLPVIRS